MDNFSESLNPKEMKQAFQWQRKEIDILCKKYTSTIVISDLNQGRSQRGAGGATSPPFQCLKNVKN